MALDTRPNEQARIIVTVDAVPMTVLNGKLCVLVSKRGEEPFAGREALIGGYVRAEEDIDAEATVSRVLARKAGLSGIFLEQLRTFSGPLRDPRGWSLSVAYFALVPYVRLEGALGEGMALRPADAPGELAFDHNGIVATALERVRGKGAYSTLPARLLPTRFTLTELRRTYEVVLGEPVDDSSFRRKILGLGIIQEIPGATVNTADARRPARLYCLKPGTSVFERRI